MVKSKVLLISVISIVTAIVIAPGPVMAQGGPASSQQQETTNIEGTVVSSTQHTMVVRLDTGLYQLFIIDRDATRPKLITNGARVRTISSPGDEPGVRIAYTIAAVESAPAPAQPQREPQAATDELQPPIPPVIRKIERDIQREARRYRAGVRAGAGLDPEMFLVGVHARIGPLFQQDVTFRPNLEFGLGEVTALIALNLEAVYRFPASSRQGRWQAYAGAGAGFNFTHQNFERFTDAGTSDEKRIDFGDFGYSTSLNILGGVQFRNGAFVELKSSLYTRRSSGLRLILGYNF